MQVVMNKYFLLNLFKKIGTDLSYRFREKSKNRLTPSYYEICQADKHHVQSYKVEVLL